MPVWYADACSLINLYACGRLDAIAATLKLSLRVVDKVQQEAGFVFTRQGLAQGPRVAIDLTPHLARGHIVLDGPPSLPEQVASLGYAQFVDAGEALTIAAAQSRGLGVVTDDAAAWKVLDRLAPQVPKTSSIALLREWQAAAVPPAAELEAALLDLEICGRFRVGPRHPEYAWWQQSLGRQ